MRLMRGRTVVAIAHRLTTLRSFDRILVLRDGRLAEEGSPSELIDANGRYRDPLQRRETSYAILMPWMPNRLSSPRCLLGSR